jgi:catechol 2,3-dioxygenase-like lactoylglutathione lyase family enzyme
MPIDLSHTIVHAHDPQSSAAFLAEILGRRAPVRFGPFHAVALDNGVTLDFIQTDGRLTIEQYAFLVSEDEFDRIFSRMRARRLSYWADPGHQKPVQINHRDGGRGVYLNDPDGYYLEIITRPYGGKG